jgi:hypothetical protein
VNKLRLYRLLQAYCYDIFYIDIYAVYYRVIQKTLDSVTLLSHEYCEGFKFNDSLYNVSRSVVDHTVGCNNKICDCILRFFFAFNIRFLNSQSNHIYNLYFIIILFVHD